MAELLIKEQDKLLKVAKIEAVVIKDTVIAPVTMVNIKLSLNGRMVPNIGKHSEKGQMKSIKAIIWKAKIRVLPDRTSKLPKNGINCMRLY